MSRTGNFGRLPRAVPSLTATLVAIAREQQHQQDQNIMEAWQKGGTVDGRKVTDDVVLKHWRDRLKDISPDDPLYDTYKNAVLQYDYAINESKMTAKYAMIADPKSGDDMNMVKFYLNWANKVPRDSEFYRVLQRDAGQYMRSARAKRDTITKAEIEKAYNARMSALEKKNELPGQSALRIVTLLAQEGGVVGETPLGNPSDIANRSNIDQMQLPGVDQIMSLLSAVTPTEGFGGAATFTNSAGTRVLYTDENGQPVTGASIVAQFKAMDSSFGGKFDLNYVKGLIADQRSGLQSRIDLAKSTGHVQDMMTLQLQQAKVNEFGRQVEAWPVAQEYNDLHTKMQKTLNDNTLLPDAKVSAINAIRAEMGKLASDPRIEDDTRMQTQLRGEAEGKSGTLSLGEDLEGNQTGYTTGMQGKSDIDIVNATLELYAKQKDDVAAGTHVMTQGVYQTGPDGAPVFVPQTNGPSVGAATMDAINNLPGAGKPVPVMVPNGDGGGATPMYVVPAPVMAVAKNADGTPMPPSNNNPVCGYIKYMVNGKEVTLYSIEREGKTSWTFDPPWDKTKVKTSESNGVITVDLTGAAPAGGTVDLSKDAALPGGFYVQGAGVRADGTAIPGTLVFKPQEAALMSDPTRQHAGHDPYTDSFSASLAAVKTSPDGPKLLTQWTGDPRFQAILDQNAHLAAGQSFDGATGLWTGGDPNAYNQNITAMRTDLDYAKTGADAGSNPVHADQWWKDSTATTMSGALPAANRSSYNPTDPFGALVAHEQNRLPADAIRSDPNSRFAGLATGLKPGSAILNRGTMEGGTGGLTIGTGISLTVPNVAGIGPSMTPPAPVTTQTSSYTVPAPAPKPTAPEPTYRTPNPRVL